MLGVANRITLLVVWFTFEGRFLMSKTVESVINTSLIPQLVSFKAG
jgi:hypothetical protein